MQYHCSRLPGVRGARQSEALPTSFPNRSGKDRYVFRSEQARYMKPELYGKDFPSTLLME